MHLERRSLMIYQKNLDSVPTQSWFQSLDIASDFSQVLNKGRDTSLMIQERSPLFFLE
jgi:hypothetical protein